jgi:hypothetical protein
MQNLDPLACVTHSLVDYVMGLAVFTDENDPFNPTLYNAPGGKSTSMYAC